jgi:hypothetical protein
MRIGRRLFLGLGIGVAAILRPMRGFAALMGPSDSGAPYPTIALTPYLDTLIPADETGSATAFGVDEHIRYLARLDTDYIRLLQYGCKWLDEQARALGAADFPALTPAQREAIVTQVAAAPQGSPLRSFFDKTRSDAMAAYYGDPRSWASLGFRGPPQPEGYPDFAEPPA